MNVKGNICEVIGAYVENMSKNKIKREKEYDSNSENYRKTNEKETERYVKNQLSELPIH